MFQSINQFFRWLLGRGEYCVLRAMRSAVGLTYGDPEFTKITSPYWERGYGTTCAVTANWALEKCGVPSKYVNRGNGWVIGRHTQPLVEYAREKGAIEYDVHPSKLVPGDYFYIQGDSIIDWHVGIVEFNRWPHEIITLDGGQVDTRGEQAIARVTRPYIGEKIGPRPRSLKFRIRTEKLF